MFSDNDSLRYNICGRHGMHIKRHACIIRQNIFNMHLSHNIVTPMLIKTRKTLYQVVQYIAYFCVIEFEMNLWKYLQAEGTWWGTAKIADAALRLRQERLTGNVEVLLKSIPFIVLRYLHPDFSRCRNNTLIIGKPATSKAIFSNKLDKLFCGIKRNFALLCYTVIPTYYASVPINTLATIPGTFK